MSRNPILKTKESYITRYMVEEHMRVNNLTIPCSFPLAFRIGKKKKIKNFHVLGSSSCECCGTKFYVKMGGKSWDMY